MRVANTLTITNRYKETVCYWTFTNSDRAYLKYDQAGWLRKDEAVTIDVGQEELQLGFCDSDSIFSKWYAKPKHIKPDRSVTLTAKAEIVQPQQEEFPNPNQTRTVNFFEDFAVATNDTLRSVLMLVLGKIPEVGGAVAGILGYLWAEQKPKVEDLIAASEDRMKAWVHGLIADYDRAFLTNKLGGLRKNLTEYLNAKGRRERQTWMDASLALFNEAQGYFVKPNYTPGTLNLVFDLATLHLALLRERVVHTTEIFDEAVNLEHFKKALKETIAAYQDFVKNVGIPGELAWRSETMEELHYGPDGLNRESFTIRDHAVRQVHAFSRGINPGSGGDASVLFRFYKQQALNSYRTQLQINIGDPALLWSLLDPDQAKARPVPLDRVVWVGPCTGLLAKGHNEHGATDAAPKEDRAGIITKLYVREYNEVDYLKVFYDGHEGNGFGNPKGGAEHTIQVPQGQFVQRVETWWDWELSGIKFDFTDGTTTGKLGNRTGIGQTYQAASYPRHRLSAIRVDGNKCALWFGFTPLPNYYEAPK